MRIARGYGLISGMGPKQAILFLHLWANRPVFCRIEDLFSVLWPDEDEWPDSTLQIASTVKKLRQYLARRSETRVRIECVSKLGYRMIEVAPCLPRAPGIWRCGDRTEFPAAMPM